MARLALRAAATLVRVVFGMAVVAGCRRALERRVGMAGVALRRCMLADQRPFGRIVIEPGVGPADWLVAVAATVAHVISVRVVVRVAARTGRRRISVLVLCGVAIGTCGIEVPSDQREVGHAVIERVLVETNDVGVAAEMVGVTSFALCSAGVRVPAVESGAARHVVRHDVVAVQAQTALRLLVEGLVTARARGFDIGVSCDDIAGHQQALDVLRV